MEIPINKNKIAIAKSFLTHYVAPAKTHTDIIENAKKALFEKASVFRPGTWRIKRNALAHAFEALGHHDSAVAIKAMVNPVTASDADEAAKALKPKKQARCNKVTEDEHEKIISFLKQKNDLALLGAVIIARAIGVRPVEMTTLVFDDEKYSITVKGAKKRDKGDRGIDRTLLLEAECYFEVKTAWTHLRTEFDKPGTASRRAMKRIQNRLYDQVRQLFETRKSYPSLYSYRHQLGGDLKASGMDRVTIAAIMGHASVDSVNAYGNRRHGGRRRNIEVSDESLDAVKKTNVSELPRANNTHTAEAGHRSEPSNANEDT